jgi:hypothetical protein
MNDPINNRNKLLKRLRIVLMKGSFHLVYSRCLLRLKELKSNWLYMVIQARPQDVEGSGMAGLGKTR